MHGRKLDGRVYTFGHEGVLYRQSFVMYDKQTGSLWVHTTGEAVKGELKGKVLPFLPSTTTTWKAWKRMHPETTVLTGRKAKGFMGRLRLARTPARYGLSVGQGTAPKLYPFEVLMRVRVVNDEHAGRQVVVVYEERSRTGRAYLRGGRTFAWKDGMMRDPTGAAWDLLTGLRVKGKARLEPLPATTWLVHRWRGFHPKAPVYRSSGD